MTPIEQLRDKLIKISERADNIKNIHGIVAETCGISNVYSQQIRKHKGAKENTKKNIDLVNSMINAYRLEIKKAIKRITEAA